MKVITQKIIFSHKLFDRIFVLAACLAAAGLFAGMTAGNNKNNSPGGDKSKEGIRFSGTSRLLAHEWGTFTTVHTEEGNTVEAINYLEDYQKNVLPGFVHRISDFDPLIPFTKSSIKGHPDITMRLETPVLYFYPPANFDYNQKIDVNVIFHGGLLNEFYPMGESRHENLHYPDRQNENNFLQKGLMNETSKSFVSWKNIQIGGPWALPETDANVWLAPRQVESSYVKTENGETERYIFYRGLAHLKSIIRTEHQTEYTRKSDQADIERKIMVKVFAPDSWPFKDQTSFTIPRLWFVYIAGNGNLVYAEYKNIKVHKNKDPAKPVKVATLQFTEKDYINFHQLRDSIKQALVQDGLFDAEAEAMLNTWNYHYFNKPGARVLFILPKIWADKYLPIQISVEHDIVRTFIGRIDLQD